jgi:hypothetical protein
VRADGGETAVVLYNLFRFLIAASPGAATAKSKKATDESSRTSTCDFDPGESRVGREVYGNGDVGLVKVDRLGVAGGVDGVIVNADAESNNGS